MKKYPEYKNSCIEWIDQVPSHWSDCRIRTLINKNTNGVWGDEPNNDYNDIVCVRVADFDMNYLGVNSENLTYRNISKSQQNGRLLFSNDLLIEKSGGGEKQPVGRVIRYNLNIKAVCSNFIAKLELSDDADPSFMVYLFNYLYSIGVNTRSIKQTTGIQNLDTGQYFNERFQLPPLHEQTVIANFLDLKSQQIEDLIAKKERLIELLTEERNAIINQVVTKGLDPNVPMKDSGIEWLGEIPEHWEVKRLKYVSLIVLGKMLTNYDKGGYQLKPYLRAQNINWFNVNINDIKNMWFSKGELDSYRLSKYDLLVSEGGEVGRTCIWLNELNECYIQNSVHKVTFNRNQSPYYFLNLFFVYGVRGHFDAVTSRVSIAHLTREKLKEIFVLIPPHNEQQKIAEYIENKSDSIINNIENIEHEISLLSEYKTSLINEAVTGKIYVRDYNLQYEKEKRI